MTRFAVLATGTEIGKTHIACALLRRARSSGARVAALKPVMSGFAAGDLAASDAGRLALACGLAPTAENVAAICLHAFEEAVAPNVAARNAGATLDYEAILGWARDGLSGDAEVMLLEGAGGVLSPVTDTRLNADLAADLGLPAILVSANYLGSVSHTLSAIESCERRGVRVAAVAISRPSGDYGAPEALVRELARWTPVPCVDCGIADDGMADRLLACLSRDLP